MTDPHGTSPGTDMSGVGERNLSRVARAWLDLALQARAAAKGGDYDTAMQYFGELFEASEAWALSIPVRRGLDEVAEDLVQEAFVQLQRVVLGPDPLSNVKGLLGEIVRRRIADELRRRHRERKFDARTTLDALEDPGSQHRPLQDLSADGNPEESLERAGVVALVNHFLDHVSQEERNVLMLRHGQGLSVEETSAQLGISADQVKKRTQSGLSAVRRVAVAEGYLP
jgi:RNA polymerase sigma factor (sigma-70 family)